MNKTLNADVIFLGADGVGKSTLLYLLKSNEIITTEYSKTGFNEEKINYKNRQITIFDIELVPKLNIYGNAQSKK